MDLTLAEYLKERSPSPAAVSRLLLRCTDLLQRVHNQGVCHYDVKAANFLISEDGSRMVSTGFMATDRREVALAIPPFLPHPPVRSALPVPRRNWETSASPCTRICSICRPRCAAHRNSSRQS